MKKNALLLIFAIVATITALTSCGGANPTEKQLDGKWTCQLPVQNVGTGLCEWTLDAATHHLTADMSTSLMGLDNCLSLTITGQWSATPDSLTFTIDDNGFDLKISDELLDQVAAMGMDKDAFYTNARENLEKEFGTKSVMALSNLTDTTFTVTQDNMAMDFTRMK